MHFASSTSRIIATMKASARLQRTSNGMYGQATTCDSAMSRIVSVITSNLRHTLRAVDLEVAERGGEFDDGSVPSVCGGCPLQVERMMRSVREVFAWLDGGFLHVLGGEE